MNTDLENVKQAKESFNSILDNKKYAGIIKDDKHLSLLLDLLNKSQYNKILDIGTGTGYLAFPLAEQFPTASICGIDIAEIIVEKNNATVKEKVIHDLSFEVFDGLTYPFSNEYVDLIVTRYAFHHFQDVVNAVQQMNRILVKGGKVLISDPMRNEKDNDGIIDNFMRVKKDGHIQFYSSNELDELFISNGFTKEKQIITNMKFPFAKQVEYINLYDQTTDKEKLLYDITNDNGIIWIEHIDVGNTIFTKQ
ncbi:class I SAM-dependent methyltransferase [bacterium 1xD8-6]|nr:class I SAM-dependent methyltransferase [bacterium D16-36]RKI63432.1 class I SAM-dependent methyltransferase [bacterium 1xD8-6]